MIPDLSAATDAAWNVGWSVFPVEIFIPCFGDVLKTVKRLQHYRFYQGSAVCVPVQHIAVRNIEDRAQLDAIFQTLKTQDVHRVLLVGGNSSHHKLFESTLDFLKQFDMKPYGITHVYFAGHPEGHPSMADPIGVLKRKVDLATMQSYQVGVVTQFSFNQRALVSWLAQAKTFLSESQIRIGVMGPSSLPKLIRLCRICGVNLPISFLIKQLPKLILGRYLIADILRTLQQHAPGIRVHVFGVGKPELAVKWLTSEMKK